MKGIVAMGFDGVFTPSPPLGSPTPGIRSLVKDLFSQGFDIEVCTPRALTQEGRTEVVHWLNANGMLQWIARVSATLPPAVAYVGTRAVRFDGDCLEAASRIRELSGELDEEGAR